MTKETTTPEGRGIALPDRDPAPPAREHPTAVGRSNGFLREVLSGSLLTAGAFGCGSAGSGPPSPEPEAGVLPLPDHAVRLAFNESPFGPPPGVWPSMEEMLARPSAMDAHDPDFLPGINRYPDFLNVDLTNLIARYHDVSPAHVVPCCGISEVIYMCSQAFVEGDRHLLVPEVSYALPAWYARHKGCRVRTAPMDRSHGIDLDALLARVGPETGLVYLANPNNPTGSLVPLDRLASFVRGVHAASPDTVVLVDEAYMDYVREKPLPEAIGLVREFRLVVGRTFSKAFGMAGLRAGYLVGHEETVLTLNGFLSGYLGGLPGWRQFEGNVNRMAVAAVEGCLNEEGVAFLADLRERNVGLRERLFEGLAVRGFAPLPSHGNFLFVNTGSRGENLRRFLCTRRILVQAGASFGQTYVDWVRVSVGSVEEIDLLMEALKAFDPFQVYPEYRPVFFHGTT